MEKFNVSHFSNIEYGNYQVLNDENIIITCNFAIKLNLIHCNNVVNDKKNSP